MENFTFENIISLLESNIPAKTDLFPGEIGLKRMKLLLQNLKNPQENFKSIHIAGTSGKGSTATVMSMILEKNGYKVGLTLSPHLIDVRERIQLGNTLITKSNFVKYFSEIYPAIAKTAEGKYGHPTYFEMVLALAFYYFYKNSIDYAVIETGLGGKLDGTNAISRNDKISVITRIGLDHMQILGNNISKIAKQKAGIINENSICFSIKQSPTITRVIEESAKLKKAKVEWINPNEIKIVEYINDYMTFQLKKSVLGINIIRTRLLGRHQAENILLALKVIEFLQNRYNLKFSKDKTLDIFSKMFFPGRFEVVRVNHQKIILDGAHNPQKMRALVNLLKSYNKEKYSFLIAIKKGKNYKQMLKLLFPITQNIIFTKFQSFQENASTATDPWVLHKFAKKIGFKNSRVEEDLENAVELLLKEKNEKVITGSLYLIGEVKKIKN